MIYEGSRYEDAAVVRVPDTAGRFLHATYGRYPRPGYRAYQWYVMEVGDRFDTLADRVFGDPELWWMIADLNPEVFYPAEVFPGTVVRLPIL